MGTSTARTVMAVLTQGVPRGAIQQAQNLKHAHLKMVKVQDSYRQQYIDPVEYRKEC